MAGLLRPYIGPPWASDILVSIADLGEGVIQGYMNRVICFKNQGQVMPAKGSAWLMLSGISALGRQNDSLLPK